MPVKKENFELSYDAAKVREALRAGRARRGVKVSASIVPTGTRLGVYKPQAQKRKDYHAV